MKNLFNTIQLKKPNSNSFDLTHDVKMSTKMGLLTPIMQMECIPGDKVTLGADSLIRFAPLIAPVMHRLDVTMHYFFVPNRILWDGWEKFIVGAEDAPAFPKIQLDNSLTVGQKKFLDYMGVPPFPVSGGNNREISALPLAAYQAIYNEYYRDQNLIDDVDYKLANGLQNNTKRDILTQIRMRALEHDYFTASLPFAQKGEAVDIPLGQVTLKDDWDTSGDTPYFIEPGGAPAGPGTVDAPGGQTTDVGGALVAFDPNGSLEVGATTINDLRRAFKLQEWLEKNARGGTRYIENILSHFGVKSSDARLQRPEYITGVKSPVIISEVLNTTGEDAGLPQGNMAGHAVAVNTGKTGSYYAEEHGYIIGIMSVLPRTAYYQGLPKHYLKDDYLEFFWPSFAHIGEQEVITDEIYAYAVADVNSSIFGYVPRYAEYKYLPSRVAGDFRTSLDYWHLARKFASAPTLSKEFIECNWEEYQRIFAVTDDDDNLYCHVLNKVRALRKMPKFGTPSM